MTTTSTTGEGRARARPVSFDSVGAFSYAMNRDEAVEALLKMFVHGGGPRFPSSRGLPRDVGLASERLLDGGKQPRPRRNSLPQKAVPILWGANKDFG